jgi:hypothetical protein
VALLDMVAEAAEEQAALGLQELLLVVPELVVQG